MKNLILIIFLFVLAGCGTGVDHEAKPTIETENIIIFGDSFAATNDWQEALPGQVVSNEGVGGETTSEILNRVPGIIESYEPQRVFIIAGINDLAQDSSQAEQAFLNYVNIVESLERAGFQVCIISVCYLADSGYWSEQVNYGVAELNNLLEFYTMQNGLNYIDLAAVVSPDGSLDQAYDYGDGTHLNEAGYDIFTDLIKGVL